ncbi:uncharacterized protein V1510DRAFT_422448 [Dipodascopsis tothii]|uniref:uncharacterized protein n=1 Tax=Dipodascopsis tothii TaxID=44089 RepID=UPI0034CD4A62
MAGRPIQFVNYIRDSDGSVRRSSPPQHDEYEMREWMPQEGDRYQRLQIRWDHDRYESRRSTSARPSGPAGSDVPRSILRVSSEATSRTAMTRLADEATRKIMVHGQPTPIRVMLAVCNARHLSDTKLLILHRTGYNFVQCANLPPTQTFAVVIGGFSHTFQYWVFAPSAPKDSYRVHVNADASEFVCNRTTKNVRTTPVDYFLQF